MSSVAASLWTCASQFRGKVGWIGLITNGPQRLQADGAGIERTPRFERRFSSFPNDGAHVALVSASLTEDCGQEPDLQL